MIKNRNIVVIGASGGIGEGMVRYFAKEGARIVLSARNKDKLLALQKSLGEAKTHVVPADATIPEQVVNLLAEAKKKFGSVDAVIISAGTWKELGIDETGEKAFKLSDLLYESIFLPSFIAAYEAQKFFRAEGEGLIVSISSHAALKPQLKGNLTYGPMKAAQHHLMLSLRHELKGSGVRVVDIAPALVNTPDNAPRIATLDAEKRAKVIEPEKIARWIGEHLDDLDIPDTMIFDNGLVI